MKSLNISRLGLVIALVAGVALSWTSLTPQALNASEITGGCDPECYSDNWYGRWCDNWRPECGHHSVMECELYQGGDQECVADHAEECPMTPSSCYNIHVSTCHRV